MKHIGTVLSLFDGMSCGQLALNREGITYDAYYASEIDQHSIKVAKANYPNTIHLGDVRTVFAKDLPKIDLLIGGSPCQGFSFAGKQLNFEDPRSKLFFEYVRVLEECKPKYWFLENVPMKQEFCDIISRILGTEPIVINSALVSGQNRVRLYWTNIRGIQQPKDRGILLKDIVDPIDMETNPISKQVKFGSVSLRDCDTTQVCHHIADATDINGNDSLKRVYADSGKSPTLVAMSGGNTEPKILCGAIRGRFLIDGVRNDKDGAGLWTQYIEPRFDEKSNTLTTVEKDNCVIIDNPIEGVRYKPQDLYWRKLTPEECEKLQTVPVGFTNHVSKTQRYRMLGNGWTIDVIAHAFSYMFKTVKLFYEE